MFLEGTVQTGGEKLLAERRRQLLHGATLYQSASTWNPELPLSSRLVPGTEIHSVYPRRHVPGDLGSRSDLNEINLRKKFHLCYSPCKLNFAYKQTNVISLAHIS
jgi:hypothetical protein